MDCSSFKLINSICPSCNHDHRKANKYEISKIKRYNNELLKDFAYTVIQI